MKYLGLSSYALQGGIANITYATFANLPTVGNSNMLYYVIATGSFYYWNGSAYVSTSFSVPSGALTNDITSGAGWDADTNDPEIVSGTGNQGDFAIVSIAGTTTIDGISSWQVGDYIWYDDDNSVWRKIDNQVSNQQFVIEVALSNIDADIEAVAGVAKFPIPEDLTFVGAFVNVTTAPVGSDAVWDVNITGVGTILSTKITVEAGETSSLTATNQPVFSTTDYNQGDGVTVDCDQEGASTPGQNAVLVLIYTKR
jgi:hypothetical protein